MPNKEQFKEGDSVTYCPKFGNWEKGVVKSLRDDIAFVVFRCGGEWHHYQDYTGQSTRISDLKHGWISKPINNDE